MHVHLIGAGGIGISAVGKFLLAQGHTVSGSDAVQSLMTDDLAARGVAMTIGHASANIPAECDLVVYTEAASEENPERAEATKRGLRQLGHFDYLGELSKSYRTICITGTNGKSTTTAMTGKIFEAAGLDPTVFVGSLVPGWELGNLRLGKSDILIIEGDEYKQKMVKLFPEVTVITNIEEDHLDVYRDLAHIVTTFQELADKTSGAVYINADDANSQSISAQHLKTFNVGDVAGISLLVPGNFNRANAAAARAAASTFNVDEDVIASALAGYTGIWRRFERVGELHGATIISDYGHHPTAVRGTLAAAKEFFPGRRIVLCFQPHQHNRTKELFNDFTTSFNDANVLILAEIYGVTGRTEDDRISSLDLLNAIQKNIPAGSPNVRPMEFAANLDEAEEKLRAVIQKDDVVIIMGAGDIDEVARKLVV